MENKFLIIESALNTILNINIGKDIRLRELGKLEEYAAGLIYLTEDKRKRLDAVLTAFRVELNAEVISEECIGGYNKILKELLSINYSLRGHKCVVYGDNWLARSVKQKMKETGYCAFDWHAVNPAYIDEYDLYILCDEPLKIYEIAAIPDKEKILKIWDYFKYKFVVFPAFYETYMNFKRNCDEKVRCIITGNKNIKSAVNSSLLHTKSLSLTNNGQDLFYDFKMFCHACESIPELKYAVIGLAPFSLRYDSSKSKVEWRRCLVYYPIVHSMHNCVDAGHLITIFESEDKKIKQYFDEKYMETLYDVYEEHTKSEAEAEAVYDEKSCSRECMALNQREISELYNRPFTDIVRENKVILEDYVRFCSSKKIKAVFFIPPYTDWYKAHMQYAYYEELTEFVKELCGKYDAELVDMLDVSLPDCCFSDYANLNSVGAVKAASRLNEIIDR